MTLVVVVGLFVARQVFVSGENTYAGTLEPRAVAALNFTSTGPLGRVFVTPGQHVRKGELLARQSRGSLPAAIKADAATVAYDRQRLRRLSAVPPQSTQAVTASAQVAEAKAQVSRDEAQERTDQQTLAELSLRSPIAGTVADVSAARGDLVGGNRSGPQTASADSSTNGFSLFPPSPRSVSTSSDTSGYSSVVTVVDRSAWQVQAQVPEKDVGSLGRGDKASVVIGAISSHKLTARVVSVGLTPTTSHGATTYAVLLDVVTPGIDGLRPGMSSSVTFAGG